GGPREKLDDACGITFQQIQKYEKGTNRIGASRLQQIADILSVPPAFFFENAPPTRNTPASVDGDRPTIPPEFTTHFLATSDGLALARHFMRINDTKLRRRIVDLVEQIAGEE